MKLKSRLIRPSIVLPLGRYLAGVHHLRLLQRTFNKDQHGLRERDINHQDKQNFDAVLHITSKSVITLLSQIPDAMGTSAFLEVIACVQSGESVVCSLLHALLASVHYTLGNNFITLNAYMCVELNAHSLISFLMTIRDSLPPDSQCFVPWMLGSQSCEKIFRAARSLSSTFSTVINFGMLGLLRRLHRLHVQFCLQAQSEETGIRYPSIEAHKNKDGQHNPNICCVCPVTNKEIMEAVKRAREKAKKTIEALGMAGVLQKNKVSENPPIPVLKKDEVICDDEDDDMDDALAGDEAIPQLLQEANSSQDPEEVASGISHLTNAGMIGKNLTDRLETLHRLSFKRLSGTPLPMFDMDKASSVGKKTKRKHCSFVEVKHNGKTFFINKTTAVWLLQEGERVSSDRLFRVRSKQPYTSDPQPKTPSASSEDPAVLQSLEVGDIVFLRTPKPSAKSGECYNLHIIWRKLRVLSSIVALLLASLTSQRRLVFCVHGTVGYHLQQSSQWCSVRKHMNSFLLLRMYAPFHMGVLRRLKLLKMSMCRAAS